MSRPPYRRGRVQPDGKIVAAGGGGFGSFSDFGLVRYEGNTDFCGGP